jgi:hypothetical protein
LGKAPNYEAFARLKGIIRNAGIFANNRIGISVHVETGDVGEDALRYKQSSNGLNIRIAMWCTGGGTETAGRQRYETGPRNRAPVKLGNPPFSRCFLCE